MAAYDGYLLALSKRHANLTGYKLLMSYMIIA